MKTTKIFTTEFIKSDGRWYPITGNFIDMRGHGFPSKKSVRDWAREREEYTSEHQTIKFLSR